MSKSSERAERASGQVREASGLDVHVVATEAGEDLDGADQGGQGGEQA
jgi:hypothetical protein